MTAGWGTKDNDGSGETPTATTTTSGGAPDEALNGSGGRDGCDQTRHPMAVGGMVGMAAPPLLLPEPLPCIA